MRHALAMAAVLALGWGGSAAGHGVRYDLSRQGTALRAAYDDGSPMAFCDVTVYSPNDPRDAFQTGTTDPNGGFAFLPDTNGVWRVTVDDGMGHLVEAKIEVGPESARSLDAPPPIGRLGGAVVGVSVLFGFFGLWAMFVRRRTRSSEDR